MMRPPIQNLFQLAMNTVKLTVFKRIRFGLDICLQSQYRDKPQPVIISQKKIIHRNPNQYKINAGDLARFMLNELEKEYVRARVGIVSDLSLSFNSQSEIPFACLTFSDSAAPKMGLKFVALHVSLLQLKYLSLIPDKRIPASGT